MERQPHYTYMIKFEPDAVPPDPPWGVTGYVHNEYNPANTVTGLYQSRGHLPKWALPDMALLDIHHSIPAVGHRIGENTYYLISTNEKESHD